MRELSGEYYNCNAGAHRNIPNNIHAPALTWHRAYWISDPNKVNELKDKLDSVLLALVADLRTRSSPAYVNDDKIDELCVSPCISGKIILFDTLVNESTLSVDENISNIDFSKPSHCLAGDKFLSEECESRRRNVTVAFSHKEILFNIRCEWHSEYFTITICAEFRFNRKDPPFSKHVALENSTKSLLDYLEHETGNRSGEGERKDNIFKNVSHRELIKRPDLLLELSVIKNYFYKKFWRGCFLFILSFTNTKRAYRAAMKELFDKAKFADFRMLILSDGATVFEDKQFFEYEKEPSWGVKAKEKYIPLLNVEAGEINRRECVINYLLGGRAFYLSNLAANTIRARGRFHSPIETIIHVRQCEGSKQAVVNEWELGRLINQIHVLGTLRLAALKDVTALHEAGTALSKFDPIAQEARDAIFTDKHTRVEKLKAAQKGYNEITEKFMKMGRAGLAYRTERSRYYYRQWESAVVSLDIKQLEGDQPYDQFVKRRLGAEFQYIDRLGRRHERATQTLQLITQSFTGLELYKMQVGAEIALFGFLIPYYFIGILSNFVSSVAMPYISICIFCSSFAFAVYKLVHEYLKEEFITGAASAVIAGFGILTCFMWLSYEGMFPNGKEFDHNILDDRLSDAFAKEKILHLPQREDADVQERLLTTMETIANQHPSGLIKSLNDQLFLNEIQKILADLKIAQEKVDGARKNGSNDRKGSEKPSSKPHR